MSLNQRISPSLSETPSKRQAPVCKQAGFTLIELIVVIAILGILMTIGGTSWSAYRESTRVDSAKEKVVSVLQQARLKALSSGFSQSVVFDHNANTMTDILGRQSSFDGVDVQKFLCGSCTASDPASQVFTFTRSGTSANKNIKVSSATTGKSFIVMVSNVTGRVDVRTSCVPAGCI